MEAEKAANLFGWKRHHIYGRLEFEVTDDEIIMLEKEKIRFWVEL